MATAGTAEFGKTYPMLKIPKIKNKLEVIEHFYFNINFITTQTSFFNKIFSTKKKTS